MDDLSDASIPTRIYYSPPVASIWEQEERQSEREREREHIISEQDTAASHYNDLVRNMVRSTLQCSQSSDLIAATLLS